MWETISLVLSMLPVKCLWDILVGTSHWKPSSRAQEVDVNWVCGFRHNDLQLCMLVRPFKAVYGKKQKQAMVGNKAPSLNEKFFFFFFAKISVRITGPENTKRNAVSPASFERGCSV